VKAAGDTLQFIKNVLPFWGKLDPQHQALLADSLITKTYAQGQSVHSGFDDCSGLAVVFSGQLRAYIVSESGKEITLYRLFERDVCLFTASCLLRNINFEIHVSAERDSRIILIPARIFDILNQSNLAVADYTGQLMSARFSDVMWVMEQVLFMSFDKRLALFLLEEAAAEGSDDLKITHDAIARHLGSAREVVTRMIKYFQSEGIVSSSRGMLSIIDRKKLEKLAE